MTDDESFSGKCPTCGQPDLLAEVARLRSALLALIDLSDRMAREDGDEWPTPLEARIIIDAARAALEPTR